MRLHKGEPFHFYRNSGTTSSFSLTASTRKIIIHDIIGTHDGGVGLGEIRLDASGTTIWGVNYGSNASLAPFVAANLEIEVSSTAGTLSCYIGTGSASARIAVGGEFLLKL